MTGHVSKRFVLIIGLALAGSGAPSWAADYYVDQRHPTASDDNPGTESQPWRTLYRAAQGPLQPGDTVYVKAGNYDVSQGSTWSKPAINLPSGAPGKPITFKSLPAHAAVLQTHSTSANPAIGVYMRSHVVIDGFVIPNPGSRGMVVFGAASAPATDIVIQNNIIHGVYVNGFDNTEGIRIENAEQVVVRNNKIYDVRNGDGTSNGSAIKTYKSKHVTIENNLLFDVTAGVKEKEATSYLTVRYNRMYGCRYGFVLNNQNGGVTEQIRYHGNVVQCRTGFETASQSTATMRDVFIYNNTFAGYESAAVQTNEHGERFHIYNNIFYRTTPPGRSGDFFTRRPHTDQVALMDRNLYAAEPKFVIGLNGVNETFSTLSAWQRSRYGLDQASLLADPGFVDVAAGNFRLKSGSPAIGAGRTSDGAAVNIGAYATGRETIGLLTAGNAAPPKAPKLLMSR